MMLPSPQTLPPAAAPARAAQVQAPRPAPQAQAPRTAAQPPPYFPVEPLPVPSPPPVVRSQSPEEPRPAPVSPPPPAGPLALPAPEQLGVAHAAPAAANRLDWAATRSQLDRLGATCFHLEKLESGWRFTCLLPAREPGKQRRIDAEAATEAEAVRVALERAGQ